MNRRNFFQIVVGVIAGVYAAFVSGVENTAPSFSSGEVSNVLKERDLDYYKMRFTRSENSSATCVAYWGRKDDSLEEIPCWEFYINGEEIDLGRAVDEHGALSWPFKGAKDGDVCTAESPKIKIWSK